MKHTIKSNEPEINYYNFIHKTSWSSYFPKLYKSGISYVLPYTRSMELEYIPGPTMSDIYLEGLLSPEIFSNFLDLIDRLHSSDVSDEVIVTLDDIKSFYLDKLSERRKYICNDFSDHDDVLNDLTTNLYTYVSKLKDSDVTNIIHGDLWFPNIILSKGNMKFVDMRGHIGSKITVKGDRLYDYAKIYQSLIGMDNILRYGERKQMDNIIDIFQNRYNNHMNNIRLLSAYTIYCSFFSWTLKQEQKNNLWIIIKELLHH